LVVWGAYEIASGIYDAYQAVKTVADKNASTGEKVATVALAGASLFLPGGGYAGGGKLAMSYSRSQLQHGFKHAADFGVTGKMSNETLAAFSSAIENHVQAAGTRAIKGTYRGQAVTHFVDPSSGLNVIQKANGEFLSGWRLSPAQLEHVLTSGKLGGGR
jgi:hypothetical protein